jgi:hypothetical protein
MLDFVLFVGKFTRWEVISGVVIVHVTISSINNHTMLLTTWHSALNSGNEHVPVLYMCTKQIQYVQHAISCRLKFSIVAVIYSLSFYVSEMY